MTELINHPKHYNERIHGIECIEIAEHMDFNSGNAFKYAWRFSDKGTPEKDLQKCIWYLNRAIEKGFTVYTNSDIICKILVVKENDPHGDLLYDIFNGFFVSAKSKVENILFEKRQLSQEV